MSKRKGRTGANARANIQPPAAIAALDAAGRTGAECEGKLNKLASAHPSAKVWKARLKDARAVIARAPKG